MSAGGPWDNLPVLRPADVSAWAGPRIAVQLILNIEHWPLSRPLPRQLLPSPHGKALFPDVANLSWVEYGLRAGMRRVARCLADIKDVTVSLNSDIIEHAPPLVALVRDRGWEVVGHGTSQRSLQSIDDEAIEVRAVRRAVESYFGVAPRGWLGPGLAETWSTLEVLRDAGYSYVLDWSLDDVPLVMRAGDGEILAVPYTLELNDSVAYAAQWYSSGELLRRFRLTLEQVESEPGPVVVSVGLHPHLVGVPHRIHELRQIVELVASHPEAGFVTPGRVADWVS